MTLTKLVFDVARKGKVSASPDGRFFVYASDASGNWDIYLQRIAGGNAINLTEDSPEWDRQPAFSPDGESIAFRSERDGGGIFIMGATGESVRRVTDAGFFPDWSPDGTRILYSTSRRNQQRSDDIDERSWIVDLASGDSRRLLDRSAMMPVWSPNGRWIAYYGVWTPPKAEPGEQWDLFTVPADGGVPIAVDDDVHFEISPAWSHDGRSLYYVSDRGGSSDLWRVPIDEKTGRRVGDSQPMTSGSSVVHVSPSGDGGRVLYTTRNRFREILRVPFDPDLEKVTGAPIAVTPPGLQARHPAVSADGEWVAFDAEFGHHGSWAIGVIGRDGTGLRQVTDSGSRDFYPDWSPYGQRLAFQSNRSGIPQEWIVNADGGGLRQLTDIPGVGLYIPNWSPDGLRLSSCGTEGAYIFKSDKPRSEESPQQLPPVGDEDETFYPTAWSPEGKFLAGVVSRQSKDRNEYLIAVYSFDSRSYQVLTEPLPGAGSVEEVWPQWLGDGKRLFFMSRGGDRAFSILDTETGEQHEVFTGDSLAVRPGGGAYMATVSPDNRDIYVHWFYMEDAISMLTLGEQE